MRVKNSMIGKKVIFKNLDDCCKVSTEAELSVFEHMTEDMIEAGIISKVDTKDNTFRIKNSCFWFAGEWIKEII
ncbi:hypothetical protein KLF50_14945 (plasmid) [Clostridium perfringens]|uniref:hypothetical protein n=1 Tax=Clostridium perfringens TaxID=1502 RepID=UPI001CCBCB98|nr:hypothetical protein [Clostridium perfringens]UBK83461.1 hypothetical protein KLF50_14945 [Clostridium perfringens]